MSVIFAYIFYWTIVLSSTNRYKFLIAYGAFDEEPDNTSKNDPKNIPRIAFIFAGSVRSFIYPMVHESIRINLIQAFCPPQTCIADVFVRVSKSDNTHEKGDGRGAIKDSHGIQIAADYKEIPLIIHAISRLQLPTGRHQGILNVKWVDVGSAEERLEMERRLPSVRHKIFRQLDPRRYSMYFGRWAAYMQAKDYERKQGVEYTWFVHTRFDMAFGALIRPHTAWSIEKVWTPDSWPCDVSDIFALLPAKYAESYFSMDLLVREGNMCLGGPNFDMKTIQVDSITQYSVREQVMIASAACTTTELGWSEIILKRKLKSTGISFDANTLGFATFFHVLVRKHSLRDYCLYLHPEHMIGWIWDTQNISSATYSGCRHMLSDFKQELFSPICPILPHKSKQLTYTGDSCLLNKEVTDWNFLPFRIRLTKKLGGKCFTVLGNGMVSLEPCISSEHFPIKPEEHRINTTYSFHQLFYFYPLNPRPQVIRYDGYTKLDEDNKCLQNTGTGTPPILSMMHCIIDNKAPQLFTILLKGRNKRLKQYKQDAEHSLSPILRTREFVTIQVNNSCLVYNSDASSSKTNKDKVNENARHLSAFKWRDCPTITEQNERIKKKQQLEHLFVIERANI